MKRWFALFLIVCCAAAGPVAAQSTFDVYGFVMMDAGYDVNQVDPAWYDVLRTTKLPASKNQFGSDGNVYFSVRQTRFGVKTLTPTDLGDFKTQFEWELFGTGVDAGQTTLRLRHAYGQLGKFGAGQTWSPFMDIDVFPNSNEYWGPAGMVFFRNIQVFFRPVDSETRRFTLALERPGASGDGGDYADRIADVGGVSPHFQVPDLSAEYRVKGGWGYFEVAGILRRVAWEDNVADSLELDGNVTGWGVNVSSNVNVASRDVIKLQVAYGEAIENYMNDAPADIGVEANPGNSTRPVDGVPLPVLGIVAFYDHYWNDRFSSTFGYSMVDIDNVDGQSADAFSKGQYALVNINHYPTDNVMVGAELQWGKRENFRDGFDSDDVKVQFSFRYNFAKSL
jgi:hypothetical protein